jgi:hypothetical protein
MPSKNAPMKKNVPHYKLYIATIVFLVLVGTYARIVISDEAVAVFDPKAIVDAMGQGDTTVFEDVRASLKDLIKKGGIQGALDVNAYAFSKQKYGIYNCHVLTHLTGHEAVVYYGSDFESVVDRNIQFCEMGYQHGAEAQVALSGGDYKNELYRMCDIVHKKDPSATCFHGAGHAFMNESLDVKKSLALCDDLIDEKHPVEDLMPCYNSVFAELTNLVGGTDGGTGMPYSGGPPLSIGDATTLQYCATFDERYRIQCLFEFSGLGISEHSTPQDIAQKLRSCQDSNYDQSLEAACIKSVSAVGAQHELAMRDSVTIPEHIFLLPKVLREAYIQGAGVEMSQYIQSGVHKDWETFCNSFPDSDNQTMCTSIFSLRI